MDPVIGLDIAKGESQVQAFLQKKSSYKKSFKFEHHLDGLDVFYKFYKEVEAEAEKAPVVIFESTGHYHEPVVQFLERERIVYIMVNPIISHGAKKSSMRKVKTDAIDASHLCELYYKEDLEPYHKKSVQVLNLRNLTRQHDAITSSYVQMKLQFLAILDQVFPEYKKVFGDTYSKVSLKTLYLFPTAEKVLNKDINDLAEKMKEFCQKRSYKWALKKAEELKEVASKDPFQKNLYDSNLVSLKMYIEILLEYQEHLSKLKDEIDTLANEIEDYHILHSIPGIGDKIAATIISEIGGIERFSHPKKLVAFAGIDPRVHESGKFKATYNRITKRGSSRLRQILYTAVLCGLRKSRNSKLKEFYQKKREEGKPHKVAMIACANKLIQWIFYILKRKEAFR
ncbi:IS110 family transposase [Chengkuizengella sp. SCS-71B]|uniref:IS110 family transposase n=1 Tax=Chengkuizengella sp. SCS-71B TaxID=3115290 RepID=UPI0032C23D26